MAGRYCGAQIEVETNDLDPNPFEQWVLVCTMTGLHESHRATLFWSPTEEEVEAMMAAEEEEKQ